MGVNISNLDLLDRFLFFILVFGMTDVVWWMLCGTMMTSMMTLTVMMFVAVMKITSS